MVLLVAFIVFAGSPRWSFRRLGTDLVPDLAQGEFAFQLRLPEGTTLEATAETVDRIEAMLVDDPAFASVFSMVGSLPSAASGRRTLGENLAQINFRLPDDADADVEAAAVGRVRAAIARFPRAEAELVRPAVLSVRPPIAVQIFSDNLAELDQAAANGATALEEPARGPRTWPPPRSPGAPRSWSSSTGSGPPPSAFRPRMWAPQCAPRSAATWSASSARARSVSTSGCGPRERFRSLASEVQALRIILPGGTAVPVSAVADVVIGRGPAAIYRVRRRAGRRGHRPADDRDLGGGLDAVDARRGEPGLPAGRRGRARGPERRARGLVSTACGWPWRWPSSWSTS